MLLKLIITCYWMLVPLNLNLLYLVWKTLETLTNKNIFSIEDMTIPTTGPAVLINWMVFASINVQKV